MCPKISHEYYKFFIVVCALRTQEHTPAYSSMLMDCHCLTQKLCLFFRCSYFMKSLDGTIET